MKLVNKVLKLVKGDMTASELDEAARALWDEAKFRREQMDRAVISTFRRNAVVEFIGSNSRRLPKGSIGKVVKVMQRNVRVDFGIYGPWRVNGSLLKLAAKGEKVYDPRRRNGSKDDCGDTDGITPGSDF